MRPFSNACIEATPNAARCISLQPFPKLAVEATAAPRDPNMSELISGQPVVITIKIRRDHASTGAAQPKPNNEQGICAPPPAPPPPPPRRRRHHAAVATWSSCHFQLCALFLRWPCTLRRDPALWPSALCLSYTRTLTRLDGCPIRLTHAWLGGRAGHCFADEAYWLFLEGLKPEGTANSLIQAKPAVCKDVNDKYVEESMMFTAPPTAGTYHLRVHVLSTSVIGIELTKDVDFTVVEDDVPDLE